MTTANGNPDKTEENDEEFRLDDILDTGDLTDEDLQALLDEESAAAKAEEEAKPESEAEIISRLEAEVADLNDRLLRSAAEMQNLRRRLEREKAEATLYAASNFARDILSVSDNLSRALGSFSEEDREKCEKSVEALLTGVELTEKELLQVFEKHGIKRISPFGEKFDPHLHQAMFEVPTSDQPSGVVVEVVQAGFVIGERVLRPAMVGVSKAEA